MKRILIVLCSIILVSCSSKNAIFEQKELEFNEIPIDLRSDAHSVIRDSEMIVNINSSSEAKVTVKRAITIFEKENKEAGTLVLSYSPLQDIEYINAKIIDRNGKTIETFNEKDALDFSAYDGFSFFSDNRVKVLNLNHGIFPYTVEIEYGLKFNGTLFLPTWRPQNIGQSVQNASLKVIDKTDGVRYHQVNIDTEPSFIDTLETKVYEWKVENLAAKKTERYGPPPENILPAIKLAPSNFEIEGTFGDASTWEGFGKWYHSLGEGTRVLSEEAIVEVENVIEGLETEKEKIEALYNYLQDKTRYVSIQLGIGGWKPFPAGYVFEKEYGDCKALTNYMQAILDHLGIKSNPVLIRRGLLEASILSEFPSNQFNHVLLRVELENGEVMWLECTSKYFSPGHIGSGNEDRDALMVTENGGKIIRTPVSEASDNVSSSNSKIIITDDGQVSMTTIQTTTGVLKENLQYSLLPISNAARIEWLEERASTKSFEVMDSDFSGLENNNSVNYSYSLNFNNYATTSSSRIFVPIETVNSWAFNPDEEDNRDQEVWLPYVFSERDSSVYILPNGFEIESMPSNHAIENEFGSYRIQFEINEDKNLILNRELIIEKSKLPANNYNEFRNFFVDVSKFDSGQLVLVKSK
jgi:hypothetical protein